MDWYSYEEKYIDENDEEKTRIQYKYFDYELSKKEMEKGGYTHLGKTHLEDGKYYSLGGAVLEYDKSNMYDCQCNNSNFIQGILRYLANHIWKI
jgi:hypothetical protein